MAERRRSLAFRFAYSVGPRCTLEAVQALVVRLEHYAQARGLLLDGTQLVFVVRSVEHPLSLIDQINLVEWLVEQPEVCRIRLGRLQSRAPKLEDACLMVAVDDPAATSALPLYRCGRIDAEQVLRILGGFVRQVEGGSDA